MSELITPPETIQVPKDRIVGVDLDGVIYDFEHVITEQIKQNFPNIPIADASSKFYIADRYRNIYPEVVAFIEEAYNSQGFFLNLPLVEGALKAWRIMEEEGYFPKVNSSPISTNPFCEREKLQAVARHFGVDAARAAYIGKDKASEPNIVLIDDKPELTLPRIIFHRPYNAHEEGERIRSWSDENLIPLLGKFAQQYVEQHKDDPESYATIELRDPRLFM